MPDGSVDMVVTSPPYDNLRTYGSISEWGEHVWKPLAVELFRAISRGGVVVWVVGDATINGSETGTSFRQCLHFMDTGFLLHDTMIYEKDSCPFPETNRYYPHFEYMFVLSKGKPKTANLIADKPNRHFGSKITGTQRNPDGTCSEFSAIKNKTGRIVKEFGVRGNVWKYRIGKWKVTSDEIAYKHPAIFPEELAKDHIITWSKPGDTVLDPFMGSGTTGKMCAIYGRKFVGIELNSEYVAIAKSRIENVYNEHPTGTSHPQAMDNVPAADEGTAREGERSEHVGYLF